MADQKYDEHPPIPGLPAMAWFALLLAIALVSLVVFLQIKFGVPTP
ncbi:hypothetical protein ENSA5_39230 [Enhygromyxa salina]|uniref:Uncharacterized protein n=1 Tax=Enhygromyxa salina TaxID=215803 RepID=A0A2S9XRG5_9BACT|nr:hypothetical protein [Enhygromyxa salina]PRP95458.1 hypothetical protein ENSA5_39230 [Enhygromyxa salina]